MATGSTIILVTGDILVMKLLHMCVP